MKLLAVEQHFLHFLVHLFATYFTAFHVKHLGVWALLDKENNTSSNKLLHVQLIFLHPSQVLHCLFKLKIKIHSITCL
jgi:hypothetical protein